MVANIHATFTGSSRAALQALTDSSVPGFIRHPQGFPLSVKKSWRLPLRQPSLPQESSSELGLCFHSEKYLRPGSRIELTIPLRGEEQKFVGEVVLVKALAQGYEIGVWLHTHSDAYRARIVEQICHIECYLNDKQQQAGSPVSNDRGAREWIARFAEHIPA